MVVVVVVVVVVLVELVPLLSNVYTGQASDAYPSECAMSILLTLPKTMTDQLFFRGALKRSISICSPCEPAVTLRGPIHKMPSFHIELY